MIGRMLRPALLVVMLVAAALATAHDGGPPLDEAGCHKDDRGYYHCH